MGSWRTPGAPGYAAQPSVLAVASGVRLALMKACRLSAEKSSIRARRTRPWPRVHDLDGAGQERRSVVAVPLPAANGAQFGSLIDRGFVDFHQTEQEVTVGIGRSSPAMSRLSNHEEFL